MRAIFYPLVVAAALFVASFAVAQAPAPTPVPTPGPVKPDPKPCDCDNCKEYAIEAPAGLTVYVDRPKLLVVKCGKTVTLLTPGDEEDITVMPTSVANQFSVKCYSEGTYQVVLMVASKGEVKYVRVPVEAKAKGPRPPRPPAPGPSPGPTPTPPAPAPDALTADLQSAYKLDNTADKAVQVQALSAVYKAGADKVAASTTGAALLADLKTVCVAMKIPDAALAVVRSRIGVELKKTLVAGELTAAQKDATKALFLKLADALAACK